MLLRRPQPCHAMVLLGHPYLSSVRQFLIFFRQFFSVSEASVAPILALLVAACVVVLVVCCLGLLADALLLPLEE